MMTLSKNFLFTIIFVFLLTGIIQNTGYTQSLEKIEAGRINLPNGWHLTPVGNSIHVGDLPLNFAVSHNGNLIAVTNNGESDQSIELIDVKTERVVDSISIPQSWLGIQFTDDDKYLYASGGNLNRIFIYSVDATGLKLYDSIVLGKPWPEKISPTGLALDDSRHRLYVVTKEDNALYVIDSRNKKILRQQKLGSEAYTCLLSPNRTNLYISGWGNDHIIVYNTKTDKIIARILVGSHPNDLCQTHDGRYLFVANSQDNTVSVIDAVRFRVLETLDAALYPDSPEGSTSNSIALNNGDKRLYIANADNNCLSVFDVEHPGHSISKGFIPTGWYPTVVRVVHGKVWVANGKGFTSLPDPLGPNPARRVGKAEQSHVQRQYIGSLLRGTVSIFPEPDEKLLGSYSQSVYHNTPYNISKIDTVEGEPGNPIPMKVGGPSPIKHVFYVIKENRTYDQVLGDEPDGNGDSSLCLFPNRITPNEHSLAKEFVLLDNFYVDGEVSADGHNWSMAAYANDFVEKTWPTRYGGRGGEYDFIGNRSIALPKNGFIWDDCRKHNISFRNYGEFGDDGIPKPEVLASQTCPAYPGWNLDIHDTTREIIWEHDFDSLVAAGSLPSMNIIYLPNDHTSGLSKNAYTPFATVADNDLALGKLVEHLSGSPVWKESVVFILEDDAQDGPDHVDAHRSIAFVAGGYVRRHMINHAMYSTSSMIRTMELILGLPPMSQYDAAAIPMWRCFNDTIDNSPYKALPAGVNLEEKNITMNNLMKKSSQFDFSKADLAPEQELNKILWQAVHGEGSIMPPAKRGAFVASPNGD